jgi:hypothetical protein
LGFNSFLIVQTLCELPNRQRLPLAVFLLLKDKKPDTMMLRGVE